MWRHRVIQNHEFLFHLLLSVGSGKYYLPDDREIESVWNPSGL